ncbi:ESX secretion-associated protein EspG [Nocardia sp. GTS18]|uniref:ESX secretion-associated protein EspG n=1 Tax=Nocardia sp. GTS18 TaxID=1778064 RepID=UPI0015EF4210|nr:ESX secretion-associated protein EspG [Nocardia sp. GTS18]
MSRAWQLTDLELVVIWESLGEAGVLPRPFVFTSRTPMYYDYLREKQIVSERLPTKLGNSFENVLEAMTKPDVRIVVNGLDPSDPLRADGRVRMLALRRANRGYLITQLPGETHMHSGGYTVAECDPLKLADVTVSALPSADAGKMPEIPLIETAVDDVEYDYGRSLVEDDFDERAKVRSNKFLAMPTTSVGSIGVVQGHSEFGPRGITERWLDWRDLTDDGRYAISPEPSSKAIPVDSAQLISMINARIAAIIRAIRDERKAYS